MAEYKFIAEEIFTFTCFQNWVSKASSRIGGYPKYQKVICLDKNGNVCTGGEDMMYARDNDLFPCTAYLLTRSSEAKTLTNEQ